MQFQVWILVVLFTAAGAIISQPPSCSHPAICTPRIIASCPGGNNTEDCPTCCCESSENVEFYNPNLPEPHCTAPPAVFSVKFVATWSEACHPDYYFSSAHWSPPTGASHNTKYQMWDACMDNVSPGVAQVSQIGATVLIEDEYQDAGNNISDTFKGSVIFPGVGSSSRDLEVDKEHQWASAVTMLAPSRDRMVGVADLRLCDGHDWKKSVKVCSELFSTATRSSRFHDPMKRNSIQWNNCSFGYFEFTFKEYQDSNQTAPEKCGLNTKYMCPPIEHQPERCRTCCCQSSDNVEFLDSDFVCNEDEDVHYKVAFKYNLNSRCHPEYFSNSVNETPYFSGLAISSLGYREIFDRCTKSPGLGSNVNADSWRSYLEGRQREGAVLAFFISDKHLQRSSRPRLIRSGYVRVNPTHPYLTFVSQLITHPYQGLHIGVNGLNVCGRNGWKNTVAVCPEMFRFENGSTTTEVVQGNQCSFGTFIVTRVPREIFPMSPIPSASGSGSGGGLDYCCHFEFIIEGRVKRRQRFDRSYIKLLVQVTNVDYDDIHHINVDDMVEVEVKVSSLPEPIRFNNTYKLAGRRECGSNKLTIDETGLMTTPNFDGDTCAPYIKAGNCNDPR